jgi:hypothetical protein
LESNSLLGSRGFGVRGLSSVQSVHVRLVVLGVVENHNFMRDVRLKSIIRVRKRRKSVRHYLSWIWLKMKQRIDDGHGTHE